MEGLPAVSPVDVCAPFPRISVTQRHAEGESTQGRTSADGTDYALYAENGGGRDG